MCDTFYDLTALENVWAFGLYTDFYSLILQLCPFDCTAIAEDNNHGLMSVVASTDRPKSVSKCYVIQHFSVVVLLWLLRSGVEGICYMNASDLFSQNCTINLSII